MVSGRQPPPGKVPPPGRGAVDQLCSGPGCFLSILPYLHIGRWHSVHKQTLHFTYNTQRHIHHRTLQYQLNIFPFSTSVIKSTRNNFSLVTNRNGTTGGELNGSWVPLTAIERLGTSSPLSTLLLDLIYSLSIPAAFAISNLASSPLSTIVIPPHLTSLSPSCPRLFLLFTVISKYNLYHCFHSKNGVCAYCSTKIPIARLEDLKSPIVQAIWLKNYFPFKSLFLCLVYFAPNS